MRGLRRTVAVLIGSVVVLLFAVTPAIATNFGPYFAEGRFHTMNYVSLTQNWIDASNYAKAHLTIVTDMSASVVSYHDADIALYDQNDGDVGYYGYWTCVIEASYDPDICSHGHLVYNTYYWTNLDMRKSIACQEVGHSVGLRHDNTRTTCMRSDENFPIAYSSHDISHINGRY